MDNAPISQPMDVKLFDGQEPRRCIRATADGPGHLERFGDRTLEREIFEPYILLETRLQQQPVAGMRDALSHVFTRIQLSQWSNLPSRASTSARPAALLLVILLCATFGACTLARDDPQTLTRPAGLTRPLSWEALPDVASSQRNEDGNVDISRSSKTQRHLLSSRTVTTHRQGSRPSLRTAIAAGLAAMALDSSPPPPSAAPKPPSKSAGGARRQPPPRRSPSPSRSLPSLRLPRPPPPLGVRTHPPLYSPLYQPPYPPRPEVPSPPSPEHPSPPPPEHPSPPPPQHPRLPTPPEPPSPQPPRPPRPSPPRPRQNPSPRRSPSPRPSPSAQPLPPRPSPVPPPSPSPPSPTPPLPPFPSPQPSPRMSLGSREDTVVSNPTESDDSSDEGEGPSWPPQYPYPPNPANTPSPPPPAAADVNGRYDLIGNAMMIAVHLMAIPGTDRFFFMERPSGRHPDGSRTIAGFMDLRSRRWTHVHSPDGLFCAGHTFLSTGDLLVVGGHQANAGYPDGMRSVRTFNRSCMDLQLRKIREMGWRRWYPSATLLPDGKVLIMGGTQGVGAGTANNQFWELYDHSKQRLTPYAMRTMYLDSAQQVYYPFNYVLPSGLLFTFCGRTGWILDWTNNTWTQSVPRLRGYASTQYPFTGTSVMLGLYPERDYEVEIMLFGGQAERAIRNLTTVAARGAQRLRLTWDAAAGNYTFDGWHEESLSMGRVMPDAVLLPNGKVVVLNGARMGLAGDSASGGDSRADYPLLFADLYEPDLPRGSRVRRLAMTRIPRMYHSTACLTTNGTIIVAGCDRCHRFFVDSSWPYDPSPTGKTDYRVEIFSPPYFFHDATKPRIDLVQGEVIQYDKPYDIAYSWPGAAADVSAAEQGLVITRVVLVAPCSCTHSYDMHQRLVGLRILSDWTGSGEAVGTSQEGSRRLAAAVTVSGTAGVRSNSSSGGGADGGLLTVLGPPNPNIAPPGMYMLFLLNGDVYSSAVWVRLEH